MSLTDFRPRPGWLSRASGWSFSSTSEADLSCCLRIPLVACHRHYPGGTDGVRLLLTSPALAFPLRVEGRLPRLAFSGPARRSLALWPADSLSCPRQPVDIEGFRPFVASWSASTASWGTTSFQVWVLHPRELTDLSTTHARSASEGKAERSISAVSLLPTRTLAVAFWCCAL